MRLFSLRNPVIQTILLQGSAQAFLLLFTMMVARVISIEAYGEFVFGFQLGQVAATLAALGATFYLAKHFGACSGNDNAHRSTFAVHNTFFYRGIAALLLAWLAFFLFLDRGGATLPFGISVVNFSMVMLMAFLTAVGQAPVGNAIQAGRSLILCAAVVFAYFLFPSSSMFVVVLVVAALYSATLFSVFATRYTTHFVRQLGGDQRYLAEQHIFSVLLVGADLVVLRFVVGADELALYGVALFLSNIASFALYAVNANFTSSISRAMQRKQAETTQMILTRAAKTNLLLSGPFLILLAVFAVNVGVFYGEQFVGSRAIFFVLLVGQVANVFVGSVALVANVSGREKTIAQFILQSLIFKVAAGLPAAAFFGVLGMAVVAAIANAAWNLRALYLVVSQLSLNTTVIRSLDNNVKQR